MLTFTARTNIGEEGPRYSPRTRSRDHGMIGNRYPDLDDDEDCLTAAAAMTEDHQENPSALEMYWWLRAKDWSSLDARAERILELLEIYFG